MHSLMPYSDKKGCISGVKCPAGKKKTDPLPCKRADRNADTGEII